MARLISLSDQDLAQLHDELETGRAPTVWFTPAAVGVPIGGSAKVVAFNDPAEGDYVQVRPSGSTDVLSFSPSELTRTRPPRRKPAAKPATRSRPAAPKPQVVPAAPKPPAAPAVKPPEVSEPKPVAAEPPAAKPTRRRSPGRARSARTTEVTVTLHSSAEGEWTVEVAVGTKRTVRPTPVPPADIAKAARSLPPAVSQAIDASLVAAREQQQARVEQLKADLEAAQRALQDLG